MDYLFTTSRSSLNWHKRSISYLWFILLVNSSWDKKLLYFLLYRWYQKPQNCSSALKNVFCRLQDSGWQLFCGNLSEVLKTTKSGKRPFGNFDLEKLGFINSNFGTLKKVRSYNQPIRTHRKKRGLINNQK